MIQGDCLKILPTFKAESVDLVILDPPYIVNLDPNIQEKNREAIIGIDNFLSLFKQSWRILKNNRYLILFSHISTLFALHEQLYLAGFSYWLDLIWVKPIGVGFLNKTYSPLHRHETITIWKKGTPKFNAEESKSHGEPYARIGTNKPKPAEYHDSVLDIGHENSALRCMTTVLYYNHKPCLPMEERTVHPTQKPRKLMLRLVRAFSFPHSTVLDPFMGSGSVLSACQKRHRSCIGIEINSKYCSIVKKRYFGHTFLDHEVEYSLEIDVGLNGQASNGNGIGKELRDDYAR